MSAFSDDSVRLKPNTTLAVTAFTNINFSLNVTASSGDATAESAPAKIYIPMNGPDPDTAKYHISYLDGVTNMLNPSISANVIRFPLYINVSGSSNKYLYVAIKEGTGSYKIAQQFSTNPYSGVTNFEEVFSVSINNICAQTSNCLTEFNSTSSTEKIYLANFFLSSSNLLAIGATYTPDASGIYFELNLSNRIYTDSQLKPVISSIGGGDTRLNVNFTSNAGLLNPKSMRIYNHGSSAPVPINAPIGDYAGTGGLTTEEYSYSSSGEVTLRGLINDNPYYLSVLFVNVYNFATVLSEYDSGTPLKIEELLKKQACFLLTAGFGEEHYVITYFRHFRDTVLSHSYLGRKFISVYYELAPKYALQIYHYESIRFGIRCMAYVLYFIFNNIILVLSTFGLGIFILFVKKQRKN